MLDSEKVKPASFRVLALRTQGPALTSVAELWQSIRLRKGII